MKTKDISIDDVVKILGSSFETFDETRQEGLKTSAEIQDVRNKSRLKEKKRLAKKYGEDHPKVKNMESRLSYGKSAEKGLEVEIENNSIKQEPFMPDSWRVNGRVLSIEMKGIANLTLSLFDENMQWLRDLGSVCTDDRGFFSLTVTDKTGKLFEKYQGKAVFLTVSKDAKEVIHQEKDPLYLEIGAIEYRQIILGQEQCPSPPSPSPSPSPEPEPGSETWTVKGMVRKKSDKRKVPVPGAIVRITDSEKKFAGLLGERVTDQNGTFEFIYEVKSLKELLEADPDLFVMVFDPNGKQIYSSNPLRCKAGNVEELEIVI